MASGTGVLITPAAMRTNRDRSRSRTATLRDRPDRFVNGPPANPELPPVVWINPPLPVTVVDTGSGGESSPQETLP